MPYFFAAPDGSRTVAFDLGPFMRGGSSKEKKKKSGGGGGGAAARVSVFVTDAERDAEEVESFDLIGCEEGGQGNGDEFLLTYSLPALSVATFVVEKK